MTEKMEGVISVITTCKATRLSHRKNCRQKVKSGGGKSRFNLSRQVKAPRREVSPGRDEIETLVCAGKSFSSPHLRFVSCEMGMTAHPSCIAALRAELINGRQAA